MLKKRPNGWYPVSAIGMIITVLYSLVPPYIVYAQSTDIFPETLRQPLLYAMGFVVLCMIICRYTNQKPFHRKR